MKLKLKLKPCPFCGHREIKTKTLSVYDHDKSLDYKWIIRCQYCYCQISSDHNERDVLAKWDRRVK